MPYQSDKITFRIGDDLHTHVRLGEMLQLVTPFTAQRFRRAIIMPNTSPAILTAQDATDYRRVIENSGRQCRKNFQALMTIKITKDTTPEMIKAAHKVGVVAGKLYPEGVTHNSMDGVKTDDILTLVPTFEAMAEVGMLLLLHGEVPKVSVFKRGILFLNQVLQPILDAVPSLKVVLEHISTAEEVDFIHQYNLQNGGLRPDFRPRLAATITPQHLMYTIDDLLAWQTPEGEFLNPHLYCKPILKFEADRERLRWAATSGMPWFFLGSDTAPHFLSKKECGCGCAGVWSAPVLLEVLMEIFEDLNAVDKLQAFMSEFGARFYNLPLNEDEITLVRESWTVEAYSWSDSNREHSVIPLLFRQQPRWKLAA